MSELGSIASITVQTCIRHVDAAFVGSSSCTLSGTLGSRQAIGSKGRLYPWRRGAIH